jgi:hypothetical protein
VAKGFLPYQPLLEQGVCHNIVALSFTLKGMVKAKEKL